MDYTLLTYLLYLGISIALTVWVAKTLFKNGHVFLVEIFMGDLKLSNSVNQLLLVGFYLINIGYAVFTLKIYRNIVSLTDMIEMLSVKIGIIILILGGMHFLNLAIFFHLRKRAQEHQYNAIKNK